ncbi:hypothetical protein [Flavisolibacter tropicus]|uniref:hypothetical protein n=1 Tax=Flavisolibacter tropicus TaxID=1492898 RepID=UPI0011E00769|nr:hypothetical protein [Flavisolibacter tropicus]
MQSLVIYKVSTLCYFVFKASSATSRFDNQLPDSWNTNKTGRLVSCFKNADEMFNDVWKHL